MADEIVTGDMIQVTIDPPFIAPELEGPISLLGSSQSISIDGLSACLEGDELPPALSELLAYTAPPFTEPGTGKLEITLLPSNLSTTQQDNGKRVLLKGSVFTAEFIVQEPAMQETASHRVPDPVLVKQGSAQFITNR